ncbi:MAG: M12 family metallo-peptidase [Ferruginibacter sp.]
MIKKSCLLSYLLLLIFIAGGQTPKTSLLYDFVNEQRQTLRIIDSISLFKRTTIAPSGKINASLSQKLLLVIDKQASLKIYRDKAAGISLKVPSATGTDYKLELVMQDISSNGNILIGTINGAGAGKKTGMGQGLHYRGYINGDPLSIASFSVFANGEVMLLFSNDKGNFNIGSTGGNMGEYVLYNSKDMLASPTFACDAIPVPGINPVQQIGALKTAAVPTLLCKKVRVFWEADYKLFSQNFNSDTTNTANYLAGLFNQVAIMFQNEGITIELTDTYIWVTPDPYNTGTSSDALNTFKTRWNNLNNNFKADMALLIDGGSTHNGGIAYIPNGLCTRKFNYGYVNVSGSFNTVPVYSWDVYALTHEMGHLFGSNHTHWCGWNTGPGGTCGAIDDCETLQAAGACSTCPVTTSIRPSAPAGFQGTIMSYCHLKAGIGVNLANGFGPLPQAFIRNAVNNSACLFADNKWTGAINTAWENATNWSCGSIPNSTTDVTIGSGLTNYPVISSAAICRRIVQQPNTDVLVKTGATLTLTGPPN